jgi:hypothetical protein
MRPSQLLYCCSSCCPLCLLLCWGLRLPASWVPAALKVSLSMYALQAVYRQGQRWHVGLHHGLTAVGVAPGLQWAVSPNLSRARMQEACLVLHHACSSPDEHCILLLPAPMLRIISHFCPSILRQSAMHRGCLQSCRKSQCAPQGLASPSAATNIKLWLVTPLAP